MLFGVHMGQQVGTNKSLIWRCNFGGLSWRRDASSRLVWATNHRRWVDLLPGVFPRHPHTEMRESWIGRWCLSAFHGSKIANRSVSESSMLMSWIRTAFEIRSDFFTIILQVAISWVFNGFCSKLDRLMHFYFSFPFQLSLLYLDQPILFLDRDFQI